jgi:hypothetical protein
MPRLTILVRFRAMNLFAFARITLVGSVATAFAEPNDRVIIAAMKLSEVPNYSWMSLVDEDSSSHEIEGRTTAAGITWMKMPMIPSVGRQLGRETDTQLEAYLAGKTGVLVRVGSDWRMLAELLTAREPDVATRARPMVRGSANAGNFGIRGGASLGAAAPFLNETRSGESSALGLRITHPHEELAIVVSSFTSMEAAGEIVTGTLSDIGAALLLVRADQPDVEPVASTGHFKLWLKNGMVIKYQLNLEGVVSVGHRKKSNVRVTSTTTLKNIGTTDVIVPDEAREKLFASRAAPR